MSRYNPRQTKSFEEDIPNGTSNLTMKKKVVHELPPFLSHITHQSATMTYHFRGLSMVRICPKAADHTRKMLS
jgi:hypothetical protein